MPRELIDPDDGENRAVRAFLMHYGAAGLTVERMRENLRLSGFDGCWPAWVNDCHRLEHLTKGGAQDWLRHLFALEGKAGVPPSPIAAALDELMADPPYYAHRIERALDDSAEQYVALDRGFLAEVAKLIRATNGVTTSCPAQPENRRD